MRAAAEPVFSTGRVDSPEVGGHDRLAALQRVRRAFRPTTMLCRRAGQEHGTAVARCRWPREQLSRIGRMNSLKGAQRSPDPTSLSIVRSAKKAAISRAQFCEKIGVRELMGGVVV